MKPKKDRKRTRRVFSEEFKRDAVQMLLDGHSVASVSDRLVSRAQICFTDGNES